LIHGETRAQHNWVTGGGIVEAQFEPLGEGHDDPSGRVRQSGELIAFFLWGTVMALGNQSTAVLTGR